MYTPNTQHAIHDPVAFFNCQSPSAQDANPIITDIIITDSIIIESIKEIPPNSAGGPDCIPTSLLINCASELAPLLKIIFKRSLDLNFVAASFNEAAIVHVFKSVLNQPLLTTAPYH